MINLSHFLANSAEEHKCMVRLMKMALGFNEQAAEPFLSPSKSNKAEEVVEEEIVYENVEYLDMDDVAE